MKEKVALEREGILILLGKRHISCYRNITELALIINSPDIFIKASIEQCVTFNFNKAIEMIELGRGLTQNNVEKYINKTNNFEI